MSWCFACQGIRLLLPNPDIILRLITIVSSSSSIILKPHYSTQWIRSRPACCMLPACLATGTSAPGTMLLYPCIFQDSVRSYRDRIQCSIFAVKLEATLTATAKSHKNPKSETWQLAGFSPPGWDQSIGLRLHPLVPIDLVLILFLQVLEHDALHGKKAG